MRVRPLLSGLALAVLVTAGPAWSQTPMDDPLDARDAKRVERMEKVVRELRSIVFQLRDTGKPVVVPPRGTQPSVSVADPNTAAVPVKRLTDIGGQFPAWNSTGRRVHWSIGNAHVVYDLDSAAAVTAS